MLKDTVKEGHQLFGLHPFLSSPPHLLACAGFAFLAMACHAQTYSKNVAAGGLFFNAKVAGHALDSIAVIGPHRFVIFSDQTDRLPFFPPVMRFMASQ